MLITVADTKIVPGAYSRAARDKHDTLRTTSLRYSSGTLREISNALYTVPRVPLEVYPTHQVRNIMPSKDNSFIWKEGDFQRPLYVLEDPRTAPTGLPVNYHGVPLAPLDTKVTAPQDLIRAEEENLYGDKLILSFEGNATVKQAKAWIAAYNKGAYLHYLSFHDQLVNSLLVVQIKAHSPQSPSDLLLPAVKASLLDKSPIQVLNQYASVNIYYPEFNPKKPENFKQLVTVVIRDGSPFIYKFLNFILQPVGRVIRGSIGTGLEQYKITALVETTQKRFVSQVTFVFHPQRSYLIRLDYLGLSLRCHKCFSYAHNAADCSRVSSIPFPLPATVSLQAKCPSCCHSVAACSGLSSLPMPPTAFLQAANPNLTSQQIANKSGNDAINRNESINRRKGAINRWNEASIRGNEANNRGIEATNKRNGATHNSNKGNNIRNKVPQRPRSPLLKTPVGPNLLNSSVPLPPKLVPEPTDSQDPPKPNKQLECQTADEDQDRIASSELLDLSKMDEEHADKGEAGADFLIDIDERRAHGIFLESDELRVQAFFGAKPLNTDQSQTTSSGLSAAPLESTQGQCRPTISVSKAVSAPKDTMRGHTNPPQKLVLKSVRADSPPTINDLSADRSQLLPSKLLASATVTSPTIATNSAPLPSSLSQTGSSYSPTSVTLEFGSIQQPTPYVHPNARLKTS